jgi:hypothetical protein
VRNGADIDELAAALDACLNAGMCGFRDEAEDDELTFVFLVFVLKGI